MERALASCFLLDAQGKRSTIEPTTGVLSTNLGYQQEGVNISFQGWEGKLRKLLILDDLTKASDQQHVAKITFSLNANTSSEVTATIDGNLCGVDPSGCLCRAPWRNVREIRWTGKAAQDGISKKP